MLLAPLKVNKLSLCKIKLKGHLEAQQQKRRAAARNASQAAQSPPAKVQKMAPCAPAQPPPAPPPPEKPGLHDTKPSAVYPVYNGGAKLDTDTINYIHRIYCRECRMEEQRRQNADDPAPRPASVAEGLLRHPPVRTTSATGPTSPQVEEVSLQQNKDKNKESLKRKLMLRRSVNELVDQGIYPPLKTPPAFAEQTRQLERAKTGDLLRHKIQHRPDREALVQQHILEDTKVDPSLQERQRQLKRARLQDSLSDRLANRPGPLELIERKILQADGELTDAIEEGKLQFPKSEPHLVGTRPFLLEDDSNTSEGSPSPLAPPPPLHFGEGLEGVLGMAAAHSSIPSPPDISPLLAKMQASVAPGAKFVFSPGAPVSSPPAIHPTGASSAPSTPTLTATTSKNGSSGQNGQSSSKSNRSKKSKVKSAPKSKVIKFHEYKGPPSVVKSVPSTLTPVTSPVSSSVASVAAMSAAAQASGDNTPYSVLLQQQQLFLQWQLEFQQKSLPVILPTVKSPMDDSMAHPLPAVTPPTPATTPVAVVAPSPNLVMSPPAPSPAPVVQQTPPTPVKNTKLEDFKVADLKAELKKRNLPVSGPKPVLIERLKPFAAEALASLNAPRQPPQPSPSPTTTAVSQVATPCSAEASPAVSVSSLSSGLSSLSSLQGIGNIINIQPVTPQSVAPSEDTTMTSPPSSPLNDLTLSHNSFTSGPMSPGDMDMVPSPMVSVEQPPVLTSQLSTSQTPIPMLVDGQLSRPPSVAPMDVDLGLNPLPSALVVPVMGSTPSSMPTLASSAPSMPQTLTLDSTPPAIFPPDQKPDVAPVASIALGTSVTPKLMTQQDLLRAQQQQIEDLRRQLQQSQLQLAEAQSRALQQLQQQLQQQQALNAQPIKFTLTPAQVAALQSQGTIPPTPAVEAEVKPAVVPAVPSLPQPLQTPSLLTQIQQASSAPSSAASNMTSSVVDAVSLKNNLLNLVQAQALQQSIHLNGQKLVPLAPTAQHNGQPATSVIFTPATSTSTATNMSATKPRSNTVPNGLANISGQTSSVPSSPVENSKIHRSASNPFFTLRTLKDPPKYDEAVKHKQPVSSTSGPESSPISSCSSQPPTLSPQPSPQQPSSSPSVVSLAGLPLKSHTVDDVLEILIRSGEIIPNAVDHTFSKDGKPSSSSSGQSSSTAGPLDAVTSLDAVANADTLGPLAAGYGQQGTLSASVSSAQFSPNSFTSSPVMLGNTYSMSAARSSPSPLGPSLGAGSSPTITMPKVSQPSHSPTPPNLTAALSTDFIDFPSNLTDLPFITMDWSDSDTNMNTLDLSDVLDGTPPASVLDVKTEGDVGAMPGPSQANSGPTLDTGFMCPSVLNDGLDTNGAMNIDVSDWLDVIMPSTGLTPLSSNAPVSFSSDPILTPKPQEFLDLFNMEESDLYTPSDLGGTSTFDKALEAATSKS